MIFVTLGTQDKSFERLLKAIDDEIKNGTIIEEVIVQGGYTKYESKNMKIFDLVNQNDFEKYIKECSILITHGGVGSIMTGIKLGKNIIAVPRLKKYNEHNNDHQIQIIDNFVKSGYILTVNENFSDFSSKIKECKEKKPQEFISNTKNFIRLIQNFIDNN